MGVLSRTCRFPRAPGVSCSIRTFVSTSVRDSESVCRDRLSFGSLARPRFPHSTCRHCLHFAEIRIRDTTCSRTGAVWKSFRALGLDFCPKFFQFQRPAPGRRYFASPAASASPARPEAPESSALASGKPRARAWTCRSGAALYTRPGGRSEARSR